MKSNRSGDCQPLHPGQGFGGFFPIGAAVGGLPRAPTALDGAREPAQETI